MDGSGIVAEAVLLQEDVNGVEHPVCYFFKKFEKDQKNHCTNKRELFALVLALQHFEIYVSAGGYPVIVCTDRNLLTFLHCLKSKNKGYYNEAFCCSNTL